MAAHHGRARLSYSDLETVPASHRNLPQHDGLEVVPEGYHHGYEYSYKQAVPAQHPFKDDKIAVSPDRQAPEVVGYQHTALSPPAPPTICGIRRKVFWILVGVAAFVVLAAIGGGVGGYMSSRPKQASSDSVIAGNTTSPTSGTSPTNPTSPTRAPFQNLGIAALRWIDGKNINHYRVYTQSGASSRSRIIESAWDSDGQTWTVSPITDEKVDKIKLGTPISVSAGHPHTNTSLELVCMASKSETCARIMGCR